MPLLHAAINVSDLDRSLEFYAEVFGMEPVNEAEGEIHQVWIGRGEEADVQLRVVGDDAPVGRSGVDHVAIGVESVDETAGRVADDRITRAPEDLPEMGVRIAFFLDPDDYQIEIIEPLE